MNTGGRFYLRNGKRVQETDAASRSATETSAPARDSSPAKAKQPRGARFGDADADAASAGAKASSPPASDTTTPNNNEEPTS
ncbi:hypothetical protein JN531_012750 [Flagellatimonas centrodinii]|uniref:hypothetical protein n=1 Tax=Flagellatimonas centrodinii TaxID=2806210 RepID=UPI001FF778CF|nr:hypothetical protein [Flagellatimonas centrodinii]ULQ45969.1 hypothetical protein JN531_012750 [Flagellatimonas centrodinii]